MDGKTNGKTNQAEAHKKQQGEGHAENGTEDKHVLLMVKSPLTGYGSFLNDGESDISSVTSIDELDAVPGGTYYVKCKDFRHDKLLDKGLSENLLV